MKRFFTSLGLVVLFLSVQLLPALAADTPVASTTHSWEEASWRNASPHYFFDRETAFILRYALDYTNGGMYTAVNADGSPITGIIDTSVWGFPAGAVHSTDKSHIGQAVCIRYFISEFQRVSISGVGVGEINQLMTADTSNAAKPTQTPQPLANPLDLLQRAGSCADFVMNHLEMGAKAASAAQPNLLYYYSYSNQAGTGGYMDDTSTDAGNSAVRSESIIPWSLAELALAYQKAGQPESAWGKYRDGAVRWWTWRQSSAAKLPAYGDSSKPSSVNGCNATTPSNPNNCLAGVGRDIFYPALGFTLAQLTSDKSYRDTATTFANQVLGTGTSPLFSDNATTGVPTNALQDQVYAAGYGRAILYTMYNQQNYGPTAASQQWWDFGNYPARLNPPTLAPWQNPELTDANLSIPFAHFRGREIVAGTQRSLWFFYTEGEDPNVYYKGTFSDEKVARQATVDYWHFVNEKFWDDGSGRAAWYEALNQPYKPCFSGGTDLPIADWLPPTIPSATAQLQTDSSAKVTTGDINDPDWAYLGWNYKGSGVAKVEVVYSADQGKTWQAVPASSTSTATPAPSETTPGSFTASIPAQPVGTKVQYYLRSQDYFNNHSSFPAAAESWKTDGTSQGTVLDKTLSYVVTETPFALPTWLIVGLIALAVVIIVGLIFFFIIRRRRNPRQLIKRYK